MFMGYGAAEGPSLYRSCPADCRPMAGFKSSKLRLAVRSYSISQSPQQLHRVQGAISMTLGKSCT